MNTPTPSRVDIAVDIIGRRIVAGTFGVGETLPIENELAAELGVGRNVVREAVKTLCGKGMIITARRRGMSVLPQSEWNLLDERIISWRLAHENFRDELLDELTVLRGILEPEVASMAARSATTVDTLRLFEALEEMEKHASGDPEDAITADLLFHRRMFDAAHNSILSGFLRPITTLLRENFKDAIRHDNGEHYYVAEHRAVANAVLKKDEKVAHQAMRDLLENNVRHVRATKALRSQ